MSNTATITLHKRPDRADTDANLAADVLMVLQVVNEYSGVLEAQVPLDVNDMDTDVQAAYKTLTDYLTWPLEAAAVIVKADYDAGAKAFDFSRSYVRAAQSTLSPASLADNTPIMVRFEFAGFAVNEAVDVTWPYGGDFSSGDKELLGNAGVVTTAAAAGFSFTNTRACKVGFYKPDAEPDAYVVVYPAAGTVIPKTTLTP